MKFASSRYVRSRRFEQVLRAVSSLTNDCQGAKREQWSEFVVFMLARRMEYTREDIITNSIRKRRAA